MTIWVFLVSKYFLFLTMIYRTKFIKSEFFLQFLVPNFTFKISLFQLITNFKINVIGKIYKSSDFHNNYKHLFGEFQFVEACRTINI